MPSSLTEQLFGADSSKPEPTKPATPAAELPKTDPPEPEFQEQEFQDADFPQADTTEPGDSADSASKYALRPLSPSSMALYDDCPKKWMYRYIEKLPDPPGISAVMGSFAHSVLEHLMQLPPEERTQENAREWATKTFKITRLTPEFRNLELAEEEISSFKRQAWQAITGLWHLENPEEVAVASTEQHLRVDVRGVPFRGYIDRVDESPEGLVVNDYKSGKPTSQEWIDQSRRHVEDKHLFQVMLYSAAIAEETGAFPAAARVLYIGEQKQVSEETVTEEKLADVTDQLLSTWDALAADLRRREFEPNPGPLCGWCPFVSHCEEGQMKVLELADAGKLKKEAPARELMSTWQVAGAA